MRHLDRIAGALALLILLALAGAWLRERLRPHETPAFEAAWFAAVAPPRESVATGGERWLVAVNPACPHCREHLERLAAALARRVPAGPPPTLAALVVDWPRRPTSEAAALSRFAPGGVWWDSAKVWRGRWRHGEYAEVLVFDAAGKYRRAHSPAFLPDTLASR
jgi:hypothetical protein